MIFTPQNLVYVYYHGTGSEKLVGRLLLNNRQISFEYDAAFIKTGLQLSPFKLPLKAGAISSEDRVFEGLFGLFNDSLPDGWGRLLLDRKLMRLGVNPGSLSPLDRLCFVGTKGMGALSYEPENADAAPIMPVVFDDIDDEIQVTLNDDDTYVDHLITLGGSSAGARPKILAHINDEDWLIKFRSGMDPKDIGAIEYAYHLMAVAAGLSVPKAKLFPSKKGSPFFGVQRFDRSNGEKVHMHTIAGLLHADHREPSLDYEMIMKATHYLTRSIKECEVLYRNAVFNVLSHNRDDHSKNFSFLMDTEGAWCVSPPYDLTFSYGPGGEHSTLVMGEGKKPTKNHLLKLATIANIEVEKALIIIEEVSNVIKQWNVFAEKAGVSKLQMRNIGKVLDEIQKT